MSTNPQSSPDVVIVGGGIIGLISAIELRRTGADVVLYEKDRTGGQASGAAAGMLAPVTEMRERGPFLEFCLESLNRYPQLATQVRSATGIDIEFARSGTLRVSKDATEASNLRRKLAQFEQLSPKLQWLNSDELSAKIDIPGAEYGALYVPDEGHVLSPRLVEALALTARKLGVAIHEGSPVFGLVQDGETVVGIRTFDQTVFAGETVVAAGAWSSTLLGSFPELPIVSPIRGQILALGLRRDFPSEIVFGDSVYLVPKLDGTLIVGATEDVAGFDPRPTALGVSRLLAEAISLVPSLVDAVFLRAWAGLRPATTDHLPVIGRVTDGLTVAMGHYRNGILLAPATGQAVATVVQKRTVSPLLQEFSPFRI